MTIHPLAGKPVPAALLVNVAALERQYYQCQPELGDQQQLVAFGASGHRGTSLQGTFTETHVLAITQAICDYRVSHGVTGPICVGKDTHALSALAQRTALEVLAGNSVETIIQQGDGVTPTPVISHAILCHNETRRSGFADGIVITPSHNPPEDGGLKYNPTHGGPAATGVTVWIEERANQLLRDGNRDVKRMPFSAALKASTTHQKDFVLPYIKDLKDVVDLDAIRAADLSLGVDPLGGAAVHFWGAIRELYRLRIKIVNPLIDPTFRFMTLDHDGKIRMDCSSPYAMGALLKLKSHYSVALANDPDADRHGIITPSTGLMNPNHFLAVAIEYLLGARPVWPKAAAVGKTVVSSSVIDRVARNHRRSLAEVPVGFKWFAPGLFDGSICFAGEESAGASFLRRDGRVWTTDKDGIIMALLAGEITARTGKDPGVHYRELVATLGESYYTRVDVPATPEQKTRLRELSPEAIEAERLGGEPITNKLFRAPANNQLMGGLKIVAENGWFAVRPSGTENICKIYAESFLSQAHLDSIVVEAQQFVSEFVARPAERQISVLPGVHNDYSKS